MPLIIKDSNNQFHRADGLPMKTEEQSMAEIKVMNEYYDMKALEQKRIEDNVMHFIVIPIVLVVIACITFYLVKKVKATALKIKNNKDTDVQKSMTTDVRKKMAELKKKNA